MLLIFIDLRNNKNEGIFFEGTILSSQYYSHMYGSIKKLPVFFFSIKKK